MKNKHHITGILGVLAIVLTLIVVPQVLACGGGKSSMDKASCATGKATTASADAAEGKVVEVKGKLVCMHCNLKKADECQSALQTKDGKVYVLKASDKTSKLTKENKGSEKLILVKGNLTVKGEQCYLRVASYKVL